jgi:O-acetyl-ADP-ribose deacetylase (regulator of RNase III)
MNEIYFCNPLAFDCNVFLAACEHLVVKDWVVRDTVSRDGKFYHAANSRQGVNFLLGSEEEVYLAQLPCCSDCFVDGHLNAYLTCLVALLQMLTSNKKFDGIEHLLSLREDLDSFSKRYGIFAEGLDSKNKSNRKFIEKFFSKFGFLPKESILCNIYRHGDLKHVDFEGKPISLRLTLISMLQQRGVMDAEQVVGTWSLTMSQKNKLMHILTGNTSKPVQWVQKSDRVVIFMPSCMGKSTLIRDLGDEGLVDWDELPDIKKRYASQPANWFHSFENILKVEKANLLDFLKTTNPVGLAPWIDLTVKGVEWVCILPLDKSAFAQYKHRGLEDTTFTDAYFRRLKLRDRKFDLTFWDEVLAYLHSRPDIPIVFAEATEVETDTIVKKLTAKLPKRTCERLRAVLSEYVNKGYAGKPEVEPPSAVVNSDATNPFSVAVQSQTAPIVPSQIAQIAQVPILSLPTIPVAVIPDIEVVDVKSYSINGLDLVLIVKPIERMEVNFIVNAANGRLQHGGGVAKAISTASGPKMQEFCNSIFVGRDDFSFPPGESIVTPPFLLKTEAVVHVSVPDSRSIGADLLPDLMDLSVRSVFTAVERLVLGRKVTLAFPALGTGIFRVELGLFLSSFEKALVNLTWNPKPKVYLNLVCRQTFNLCQQYFENRAHGVPIPAGLVVLPVGEEVAPPSVVVPDTAPVLPTPVLATAVASVPTPIAAPIAALPAGILSAPTPVALPPGILSLPVPVAAPVASGSDEIEPEHYEEERLVLDSEPEFPFVESPTEWSEKICGAAVDTYEDFLDLFTDVKRLYTRSKRTCGVAVVQALIDATKYACFSNAYYIASVEKEELMRIVFQFMGIQGLMRIGGVKILTSNREYTGSNVYLSFSNSPTLLLTKEEKFTQRIVEWSGNSMNLFLHSTTHLVIVDLDYQLSSKKFYSRWHKIKPSLLKQATNHFFLVDRLEIQQELTPAQKLQNEQTIMAAILLTNGNLANRDDLDLNLALPKGVGTAGYSAENQLQCVYQKWEGEKIYQRPGSIFRFLIGKSAIVQLSSCVFNIPIGGEKKHFNLRFTPQDWATLATTTGMLELEVELNVVRNVRAERCRVFRTPDFLSRQANVMSVTNTPDMKVPSGCEIFRGLAIPESLKCCLVERFAALDPKNSVAVDTINSYVISLIYDLQPDSKQSYCWKNIKKSELQTLFNGCRTLGDREKYTAAVRDNVLKTLLTLKKGGGKPQC